MAGTSMEERLSVVEHELAQLKQQLTTLPPQTTTPWWKKIIGVYKDDPEFDAAERLGKEYRQSQRPHDAEDDA